MTAGLVSPRTAKIEDLPDKGSFAELQRNLAGVFAIGKSETADLQMIDASGEIVAIRCGLEPGCAEIRRQTIANELGVA